MAEDKFDHLMPLNVGEVYSLSRKQRADMLGSRSRQFNLSEGYDRTCRVLIPETVFRSVL